MVQTKKKRSINQWNKIPRNEPHVYTPLIFFKVLRIHNWKKIVSSIKGVGKLEIHMQKDEIGYLSHATQLKQIKT
jgi:hypothetical protein